MSRHGQKILLRTGCGGEELSNDKDLSNWSRGNEIRPKKMEQRLRQEEEWKCQNCRTNQGQYGRSGKQVLKPSQIPVRVKPRYVWRKESAYGHARENQKLSHISPSAKTPAERVSPLQPKRITPAQLMRISAAIITMTGMARCHQSRVS